MARMLTIHVKNEASVPHDFYFFQQPSEFPGSRPYSNCLFSRLLPSYPESGALLSFRVPDEPYACAEQGNPIRVGQPSGALMAVQSIGPGLSVDVFVNPLGLGHPVPGRGVSPGAFRFVTQAFDPGGARLHVGSGVQVNGQVMLSSFGSAAPNMSIDCRPISKFFVQVGQHQPGSVIDFGQASGTAAACDFSGGASTYEATYQASGAWRVQRLD